MVLEHLLLCFVWLIRGQLEVSRLLRLYIRLVCLDLEVLLHLRRVHLHLHASLVGGLLDLHCDRQWLLELAILGLIVVCSSLDHSALYVLRLVTNDIDAGLRLANDCWIRLSHPAPVVLCLTVLQCDG